MSATIQKSILSDQEALNIALRSHGVHIQKNYYGLPVDPRVDGWDKKPVSLEDFNMDGIMSQHRDFKKSLGENKGDVLKTLGAASAATLVFNPEIIAQPAPMIDIVKRRTPFLAMLPKPPAIGKTVHITRRTTGVGQTWTAGDGTSFTGVDQDFTQKTANQTYLYTPGSVAWAAQKLTEKTLNLYAASVRGHMLDHMQYKEKIFFRGFNTGATGHAAAVDLTGVAGDGIHGVIPEIEDYNSGSNIVDLAGARAVTLSDIDTHHETIEDAGGEVTGTFVDRHTFTILRKQAKSALRINDNQPNYGFSLDRFNIDGKPVWWTSQLSSAAGQRGAVTLDMRAVAEFPLLNSEVVDVAQQNADKKEFFIRNYFAFKMHTPEWGFATFDAI